MADSVTLIGNLALTAIRTFNVDAAVDEQTIVQDAFNLGGVRLTSATTPAVTKESYQEYAFTAGAITINLAALVDALGNALNATGLKVQSIIIVNPAGNSAINIAPGASNGYALLGAGNDFTVPAHSTVDTVIAMLLPEGTPDVASGARNIDVSGTGTETFKIGFTFG